MGRIDERRLGPFLEAPPASVRVALLHGDDAGLVHGRAQRLVAAITERDALRLTEVPREAWRQIELLANEAAATSLFGGGRRAVWVREATDAFAPAAELALRGAGPGIVVLEAAGDARSNQKLRRLLEPVTAAAVIPCYRLRGTALATAIRRSCSALGVRIDDAAVHWLAENMGDDSLLLEREIEKLAVQAGSDGLLSHEMVRQAGSAADVDDLVLAAFAGDLPTSQAQLEAAIAEGTAAVQLVRAALRLCQRLHAAAVMVEAGESPSEAIDALRPALFYWQKDGAKRALRAWSGEGLESCGEMLLLAERRAKTTAWPDDAVIRDALGTIARQAAGRDQPPRSNLTRPSS